MKKILLLSLFLFCIATGKSQGTQYRVYKTETGTWSDYTQDWYNIDKGYPSSLMLNFHGDLVTVNDVAKSYYRFANEFNSSNSNQYNYVGYDEKNREVLLSMYNEKGTGEAVFLVLYTNSFYIKYYFYR